MGRLRWLCLVALLSSCNREKAAEVPSTEPVVTGPEELEEKEPNNQAEQALLLRRDAVVSASLGADPSKPDEDWYRLAPASPRMADISVSGIPGGDVMLEVYEAPGIRSVSINSAGEGKPERFPNLYVERERWVRVASARKGAGGAYTLTVRYHAPEDGVEREPNDRAVDAHPLPLGQTVVAFLGHAGDEDWYRVELPEPESSVSTPAPERAPGAWPESNVVPASGTLPDLGELNAAPPGSSEAAEGSGERFPSSEARAEDLEEGSDTSWRIAQPQGDKPFPVPVPVPVPRALPPEPPSVALRIELSALEGVRPELAVLSAAEAPLFNIRGKEGEGLSLRNVGVRGSDRLVYLVVKSGWSGTGKDAKRGFNTEKAYTLTVSQEEAGANAELEPNDELLKATPIVGSGFKEGFLSPKGDVDHFVLKTAEPVLAKVELSGVELMDLELSLVEPPEEDNGKEKVLLRANDGKVKEPERLNNVACDGTCYFRVQSASRKVDNKWVRDYESAEVPYRLTIITVPDNGGEERESNDSPERATELTLGRPIRGTVYPLKDVDYYRLDLSDRYVRTPLHATLLGILKVDVGLYLHRQGPDGKLTLVQTADRAKGEQPEVIRYSAEPGVYFFEVRDARNREANFQDAYQLTVEEGQ
jgi:hypothetical protein